MTFLDILLLFIVGGVIGYIVETIYCYLKKGKIERRSGVIYGPFNPVYAFGAVLMTMLLKPIAGKNILALFIGSAILGGLYETVCSLFQEKAYGAVSWEYTGQRLSFFGGRTSLTFMLFWGVLGTFYISVIHPLLFGLFSRIPVSIKGPIVIALTIFLVYDLWLSNMAVRRWRRRIDRAPADGKTEAWIDKHFTNERMRNIYPSMMVADRKKANNKKIKKPTVS